MYFARLRYVNWFLYEYMDMEIVTTSKSVICSTAYRKRDNFNSNYLMPIFQCSCCGFCQNACV